VDFSEANKKDEINMTVNGKRTVLKRKRIK